MMTASMRRVLQVVAAGGRIVDDAEAGITKLVHPNGERETVYLRTLHALVERGLVYRQPVTADAAYYPLTEAGAKAVLGT